MTSEERVMTIFVDANPAPDLERLPFVEDGSTDYLATLERRSGEMTQLETKKNEEESMARNPRVWLVAAAVLVAVVSLGVILTNQIGGDGTPVATDPATGEGLTIVGDWATQTFPDGWLLSFSSTGRIDVSSPIGIATGTYELDGEEMSVIFLESTIDADEEFPNCVGETLFIVNFDDPLTANLAIVDGKCDGSWPSAAFRMTKTVYGEDPPSD